MDYRYQYNGWNIRIRGVSFEQGLLFRPFLDEFTPDQIERAKKLAQYEGNSGVSIRNKEICFILPTLGSIEIIAAVAMHELGHIEDAFTGKQQPSGLYYCKGPSIFQQLHRCEYVACEIGRKHYASLYPAFLDYYDEMSKLIMRTKFDFSNGQSLFETLVIAELMLKYLEDILVPIEELRASWNDRFHPEEVNENSPQYNVVLSYLRSQIRKLIDA